MKIDILFTGKGHAGTQATLESEFAVHKLHEATDREAFLKSVSGKVRGIASFGAAPVDGRLMDALPKLEIISNFGVGVDQINLDDAGKRGIIVTNTPDVLNECVADTAIALVLNTLRKLPQCEAYLRAGKWPSAPYPLTTSLGGKTMGILGLGRIGEAVAKRAMACGMKIRYHNRNRKDVPYPYDPDPIALVLNTLRKLPQCEAYLRAGKWPNAPYPLTTSLGGKTMGILGLGRIGEAVARRAMACGMRIRYHNRNRKDVPYPYDPDPIVLARNADVLMVVTPGGAETKNLVSSAVLDALGPQGYLVNIARGSVVDEPVLLKYLQEGKIAGAGLDVFADEPRVPPAFFSLDNAVLFPHVASATVETRKAMGDLQIENLRRHFSGAQVLTRVV